MIQAATCKSEEFNQFISWIRFGDGGVIGDNMRFNQRKIIQFNHLLANMLIFHTVFIKQKASISLKIRELIFQLKYYLGYRHIGQSILIDLACFI